MGDFSIQQFEESGRKNGTRFWYAHEFMKALGYDSYPTFRKAITRAMAACARLGIDPAEAFSETTVAENNREFRTYKLSRFACFLVAMHADSKKEEVAKAKVLLAAIATQPRRKGVAPGKTLNDVMGLEERAANLFRVTQTAARVKNQKLQGIEQLSEAAMEVGSEVRQMMIRHSGVLPESLPFEANIAQADDLRPTLKN